MACGWRACPSTRASQPYGAKARPAPVIIGSAGGRRAPGCGPAKPLAAAAGLVFFGTSSTWVWNVAITTCVRVATLSLRKIAVTRVFTVVSPTPNSCAICLLSKPRRTSSRTLVSQGVKLLIRRSISFWTGRTGRLDGVQGCKDKERDIREICPDGFQGLES